MRTPQPNNPDLHRVCRSHTYNLMSEPVHFVISASYAADGSNYTSVTVTVGAAAASDTLGANVVNKSGSTLPETGGIGTTIFYVLGSLLVVGAGVVLITKRGCCCP